MNDDERKQDLIYRAIKDSPEAMRMFQGCVTLSLKNFFSDPVVRAYFKFDDD